ncbi:hypothetical protein DE146DRAFT_150438 [Phaeosphaeria sp. MPI-PUGE-AT-0046c]|nr:hypothetical protein DE146DRAFT_150438 [Phaeosphaeria sp. MPI-PUGE-AT-0046c]
MKSIIATSIPAVLAAAGLYHLLNIYTAIHHVSADKISFSSNIPKSFQSSTSVKITNPHNHVPLHDTRFMSVAVPRTLSDEEILSRFIKGFFGGHVFRLERSVLRATRNEMTRFKAVENTPISSRYWSVDELPKHELPPLHSLLFGVWRMTDKHINNQASQNAQTTQESYVDLAFGADDWNLAGVHRFIVSRDSSESKIQDQTSDDTVNVRIEFAHAGCNPRKDERLKPDFLEPLHNLYAILLFREGVAEVLKAK